MLKEFLNLFQMKFSILSLVIALPSSEMLLLKSLYYTLFSIIFLFFFGELVCKCRTGNREKMSEGVAQVHRDILNYLNINNVGKSDSTQKEKKVTLHICDS